MALKSGSVIHSSVAGGGSGGGLVGGVSGGQGAILAQEEVVSIVEIGHWSGIESKGCRGPGRGSYVGKLLEVGCPL